MGIANLLLEAEAADQVSVTFRMPTHILAVADHLAEEIGVTRSDVLREVIETGVLGLKAEWDQAQANAQKKEKKNASAKR